MSITGQVTFDYTVYEDDDSEVLEITCDYVAEHTPEMHDEPESYEVDCSRFKAVDSDGCEIWDCLKSNTKFFIKTEAEREAIKDLKGE